MMVTAGQGTRPPDLAFWPGVLMFCPTGGPDPAPVPKQEKFPVALNICRLNEVAVFFRWVSGDTTTRDPKPRRAGCDFLITKFPGTERTKRAASYRLIPNRIDAGAGPGGEEQQKPHPFLAWRRSNHGS